MSFSINEAERVAMDGSEYSMHAAWRWFTIMRHQRLQQHLETGRR